MWSTSVKFWSTFSELVLTLTSNFLRLLRKETISSRFTNLAKCCKILVKKCTVAYWSSFPPIICWMCIINNGSRLKPFKELRCRQKRECSLKRLIKPLSKSLYADSDSKYPPWRMAKIRALCWWGCAGASSVKVLIFQMMQLDVSLYLEYHTRIIKLHRWSWRGITLTALLKKILKINRYLVNNGTN